MELTNKKLLILGGTNCAREIRRFASQNGVKLIATGKYPNTPLKRIADESYDIDAVDDKGLCALIREKHIDGVFPGFNEDVVPYALKAAIECGLPAYCSLLQWNACADKALFKAMCRRNGVPVTDEFTLDDVKTGNLPYPCVVKPADSCGSRGFAICRNSMEAYDAIALATPYSRTSRVLIERYMPYDTVIVHYTLCGGDAYFCGMSQKRSLILEGDGSSVMAFQKFPSEYTSAYKAGLDDTVRKMFANEGMTDGALWIEAFNDKGRFWFNEMGYRFGGSMTQHPVKWYTGIDQLDLLLGFCLGRKQEGLHITQNHSTEYYYILPLHVHAGKIACVEGENDVAAMEAAYAYIPIHGVGDSIKKSGTADQVFCYLHITAKSDTDFKAIVRNIMSKLSVRGEAGEELLFCSFDVEAL